MCVRFVWPRVSFGPARLGSVSRVFFTSRTNPSSKPLETEFRACSGGEKKYSCAACSEREREKEGREKRREEKKKKKKMKKRRRRNKRKEEGVSQPRNSRLNGQCRRFVMRHAARKIRSYDETKENYERALTWSNI